jgi:hypothetical protein
MKFSKGRTYEINLLEKKFFNSAIESLPEDDERNKLETHYSDVINFLKYETNPEQFEKKVHFIFHDYSARMIGGEIAEKNREMEN